MPTLGLVTSEMAFWERVRERLSSGEPEQARAAVALVLAGPSHEVALIRRAEHPSDPWSGHMALPGGRRDPDDASLLGTAIRETREEIGVSLDESALLGRLPELTTFGGPGSRPLVVAPYLFRLEARPESELNEEVAELLWIPRGTFRNPKVQSSYRYEGPRGILNLPAFDLEGRTVWGLTHRILEELLRLLELVENS